MRILYLLTIAISNIVTARFSPITLIDGLLIFPAGSVFAGAAFVFRDFVQLKHGKAKTYATIICAMAISAIVSISVGDTVHIVAASTVSFFASETIDTEVFSKFRNSLIFRVLISGIAGSIVDSAMFVVLGLSPIGAGMLSWAEVPYAVCGQVVVKTIVQVLSVIFMKMKNVGD